MPYKCPIKRRESAKERQRKYREKNKEKLRINNLGRYHALYKKDDEMKERSAKRSREWRLKNNNKVKMYLNLNPDQRDKARARASAWQKKNKGRANANSNMRKKRVRRACPKWVSRRELGQIYEKSVQMEKLDGVKYHVDHIVPLINDRVCGLHVPWNLQIIPASANLKKGNQFR